MGEQVGFIGLGTMGMPMATNLAKGKGGLVVCDTSREATADLATRAAGVQVVESPAEVARRSGVLFSCLPNDHIVREVYLGDRGVAQGVHEGLLTCDMSTVSAEVTREINTVLATRGVPHMEATMFGSQPQAIEGTVFFAVGGDERQVERIGVYLQYMGKYTYAGPTGTANLVKVIHQGLLAMTSVVVAEALAMCVRTGVDPATFYNVVRQCGGMGYGTYFERRAERIFAGNFAPTFKLELMRKDSGMAAALAEQAGVPAPMMREAKRTFDEALEAGLGPQDFSAVSRVIEQRIGTKLWGA